MAGFFPEYILWVITSKNHCTEIHVIIMVRPITEGNLISAYAGESQAHMRYMIYAERAEKSGYDNIARLFRAIAHAKKARAVTHFPMPLLEAEPVSYTHLRAHET